jgi:hypothetical protein
MNGYRATPGVAQTEHYRNLDDTLDDATNLGAGQVPGTTGTNPGEDSDGNLVIVFQPDAEEPTEEVGIKELSNGSLLIRLDGKSFPKESKESAKTHGANLAEHIDERELGRICDELLNGIDADLQKRQDWLNARAAGIKHLALKVENPRAPTADADTAVEGQTTVRSPILLDAVMRFQANARGELLPAGGPCKIQNTSTMKTPGRAFLEDQTKQPRAETGADRDIQAEGLETLFNRYLTIVDKEYYPDTNRMFFMQGYGGCGFKKVYRDPIRRRPVSRSVDAADIIVSDDEVSLHECGRVTHRIEMRQSVMKRMQLSGTYRDVDLTPPTAPENDALEEAESDVAGLSVWSQRPEDYKHTVYEAYCELDVAGFQHTEDGKITGLPLPYRVSIDKDSQTILEVRRNWNEGDDRYIKRMPLVKYPFIDGLGFYGIGLLNIMGNATAAVTTAWRLALDSAGFSSWPGFLYSESVSRQDTMTFRVGLGAGVKINTGGQDIRANVMSLPYKDVTAGLVQVTQHIEEEARRVGGTPELMVGEGRQDVPVGTTLAMLDQAVKVLDSVHKGMHIAQAEEFALLRELFREDPKALLCANEGDTPSAQWEANDIIAALNTCQLSPRADPNTPSHTIRVMKAVALVQLVQMNPQMWDLFAVVRRIATMVGMGDVEELFNKNPQQQQQDPKAIKAMADAQNKMAELAQKTQDSKMKAQLEYLSEHFNLLIEGMQLQDKREQRMSTERIAADKTNVERMKLAASAMVHPEAAPVGQYMGQLWPTTPQMPGGRIL